ncbi:ATP-binding protein [bacterium]|nr:ATP-binding protein [bacterium]
MKYKQRIMAKTIARAIATFPAIILTGPRQSGKTTLLRMLFSQTHTFVNLEDPDIRMRAKDDPVGFLNRYKLPVVIDEIQYVPELLSYIKTRIDENRKPGQWILTGSQNFLLMQDVTQSLAGRAAVLNLLPFSFSELTGEAENSQPPDKWLESLNNLWGKENTLETSHSPSAELSNILLRGMYPEIASNRSVDRQLWCGSYITTYIERDIRNLTNIGDLSQFERFLVSCAIRTGQILNLSDLARDIGVSVPTAKRWLSLLETGYQIYLLYPYYRNIEKRIVKSPKIYFNDPGLCSYLLGFHDAESLLNGPSVGNLFETMVVCDFLKRFLHHGMKPSMYYLRTRDGLEIDLVIDIGGELSLFEIKSTMTITPQHAHHLKQIRNTYGGAIKATGIISCAEHTFPITGEIYNYSWSNILSV